MPDQKPQRQNLASQAAEACKNFLDAYHTLQDLAERRAYLGNFVDGDFTNTDLSYLDANTIGVLFDFVCPALKTSYDDAANGGRNKQILNQVAKSL